MKNLITILVLFITLISNAQDLHKEVTKVFNFHPHKLTKTQISETIPKLDSFFNLVKKNKKKYIEPLRKELKRNDNFPYFYYDGAILLMELSKSKEDLNLVAQSLVKCNLKDIQGDAYYSILRYLLTNDIDIIDPALHILSDTKFQVYLVNHALTMNATLCLSFILPKYKPEIYIDKLIERYKKSITTENKLLFIDLFVCSCCKKADDFLLQLKQDKSQPKDLRKYVKKVCKNFMNKGKENKKKYAKYFNLRKQASNRLSDEAFLDIIKYTKKMKNYYK